MEQKSMTFASKVRNWQGFVFLSVILLCVSCNEFSKYELAQSVQSYNEKSLPQQMAEGLEWTSLSYDKVLDQVFFLYTFDEDYYDAEELLAAFEENKDEMKAQMVPHVTEGAKNLKLNGASIKIVFEFTNSKSTFKLLFSGEEIEQLIK